MRQMPRKVVMQFVGFLTGYVPELKDVHPDRLVQAWEVFVKKFEQSRATHEERLTPLERAAVSYVRSIGSPFHDGMLAQLRKQVDDEVGTTKDLPT